MSTATALAFLRSLKNQRAGMIGQFVLLAAYLIAFPFFDAATGAVWNVTSLWVARFLFGAGEAGCFPNLTRMLSAWLPLNERVRAQAVMWAFGRWGGALAPPVALPFGGRPRRFPVVATGIASAAAIARLTRFYVMKTIVNAPATNP